jgi:YVTN family beta-propeller protein
MKRFHVRMLPALIGSVVLAASHTAIPAPVYRSPQALTLASDGKTLYLADKTANCITVLDIKAGKAVADIPIAGGPNDLTLSPDGQTLYVAMRNSDAVAVVDTLSRSVTARIEVGPWPVAVRICSTTARLYTANQGDHSVSAVDLGEAKEIKRVKVVRQPAGLAVTADGSRLVATNLLPLGAGTNPKLGAEISIIDTATLGSPTNVKLPPGSTAVSGVCTSPDGKWAYVVYAFGRFNLPITQLERGWVHTYALSIIDLRAAKVFATLLLDDLSGGAADPWDVICSKDGKTLWISHAGTHEVSIIDTGHLHELLQGKVPEELAKLKDGIRENIWVRISRDPAEIDRLWNDLTAIYIADVIRRSTTGGNGPRGLALSPDGSRLFAANYFSGTVGVLDAATGKLLTTISTGRQPEADAARRGEIYFHDAQRCFQQWHSCASCHPQGRVDGLPWDFMRDGIGNGKDVISLVYIQHTSPHNRRASRATARECMKTGVSGSHMIVPEPPDVDDLLAYASSLKPEPNPMVADSAAAIGRGKVLFEGKAGCAVCHPAPYYTDQKMHNVGALSPSEPDGKYDTPTLVECYRTSPYLHDGRASSLKETLTTHDPKGQHGNTSQLTPQEVDDLVTYLLSL